MEGFRAVQKIEGFRAIGLLFVWLPVCHVVFPGHLPATSETICRLRRLLNSPRQPVSQSACRKLSRACAHSDTLQPLIVPSCCVAVATAALIIVRMSRLSQLIADTAARAVSRAASRAARMHQSPVCRDGTACIAITTIAAS